MSADSLCGEFLSLYIFNHGITFVRLKDPFYPRKIRSFNLLEHPVSTLEKRPTILGVGLVHPQSVCSGIIKSRQMLTCTLAYSTSLVSLTLARSFQIQVVFLATIARAERLYLANPKQGG